MPMMMKPSGSRRRVNNTRRATTRVSRNTQPQLRAIVRSMLNSKKEVKTVNVQSAGNLTSTTGFVSNLSQQLVQGLNVNNRVGDVIAPVRIYLDTHVSSTATSGSTRFILVMDMQNNGSTVTVADVLDTLQYLSAYNVTQASVEKRFKILFDYVMDCNVNGDQVLTSHKQTVGKLPQIYYNGATNVPTANGKGACYLIGIGSTATITFDYTWRMDFTDS